MKERRLIGNVGLDEIKQQALDAVEEVKRSAGVLSEMLYLEENQEFVEAVTDSSGNVTEGTRNDGTKEFRGNVLVKGSMTVLGDVMYGDASYKMIESEEWLRAIVDANNKVVCGLRVDGKVFADILITSELKKMLDSLYSLEDRVQGFEKIFFIIADNPEYLSIEEDSEGKILGGRYEDGTKFENVGISFKGNVIKSIDDVEGRSEITLDAKDKVISYRDEHGVLHENAGIESEELSTNHLNLSDKGMTEFQQALKEAGFHPGGAGDFSEYLSNDGEVPLHIAEPRCAYVNISGIDRMPPAKFLDWEAVMEVYDYNGNYFKKNIIINGQGKSSLDTFAQKNFAVDMFDSSVYDSKGRKGKGDVFALKIGNWVPQDGFHFKCFYMDPTRGIADICFKYAEKLIKFTDTRANRFSLGRDKTTLTEDTGTFSFDYDTGALCHPDGFPAVVYLNGEFYGLFAWNLKKHRDNYSMDKKDYEAIHIDSDTANLWSADALDWTQFEIRNPKTLICMDGSEYDGDNPKELIDSSSEFYDASNKNHKNTVKTKNLINALHNVVPAIRALETTEEKRAMFEQYFDVDSFIVFWLVCQVIDNYDGLWGRNTQWLHYKDSGKWCPTLYDLDGTIGYNGVAPRIVEPCHYMQGRNYVYGLLYDLYFDEIKAKYAEIKAGGLLKSEVFVDMVNDWCNRFGNFNIKRSNEKWECPCYRDGKINAEYWKQIGARETTEVTYDPDADYAVGDEVLYGTTMYATMLYKCVKACKNQPPTLGSYENVPYYGGCYDSPRRIKLWLDDKIAYLDSVLLTNN